VVLGGDLWTICFDCPAAGRAHAETVEQVRPDGSVTPMLSFPAGGPVIPTNLVVSANSVLLAVDSAAGPAVRVSSDGRSWSVDRKLPCPRGYPEATLAAAGSHQLWLTCAGGAGADSESTILSTSRHGGLHWELVSHLEWAGYAKTLVGDDHTLWRWGSSARLAISVDQGLHWRTDLLGVFGGGGPEVQAFAASGPRAWAFGTRLTGGSSFAYKTRDSGRHWLEVSLP
jgi:hypothetical protein